MSEKIGAGHASAMGRAGFKELGQALVALPDSNIRPVEEPGLAGNLTQKEIADGKEAAQEQPGIANMIAERAERIQPARDQERGMER